MDIINTLVSYELAGNSFLRILGLLLAIFISSLAGKILKNINIKISGHYQSINRLVMAAGFNAVSQSVVFMFFALGVYFGINILEMSASAERFFETSSAVLLTTALGYMLYWLVDMPSIWFSGMAVKTESSFDDMLVPIIRKSLRVTIFILVLVQIAQILSDKPITSIIAGLGIGGLAIALAAQDTIKNVFGSIILIIDNPFKIGDRIVVDANDGIVEELGLRSTKIRTLDGHLVSVPNGELANKAIRNIGKRPFIKRTVDITITYDSSSEKIDLAIDILKKLLDNHEGMVEDLPPGFFSMNSTRIP